MADYMINGTSWTIRGDIQELYLGYREYKYSVGYKNYAAEYIEPLKRMIASDKTHAKEYQDILNNIENLYRVSSEREVSKIQDEFLRVFKTKDLRQLERFHRQLDIIAEGYRAQAVHHSI